MTTHQTKRAQVIAPEFEHLFQSALLASGLASGLSIAASLLFASPSVALAGIGSASFCLYALAPSRLRATETAASLLITSEDQWDRKLSHSQSELVTLSKEYESLLLSRQSLAQKLAQSQSKLAAEVAEAQSQQTLRQRQIDSLRAEILQLKESRKSIQASLSAELFQIRQQLEEKRHSLAVHVEAVQLQILGIWSPLCSGLLAVCDRYDGSRPVSDLAYAGKPVVLDQTEKQQWSHYRASLTAYDADLRERIAAISDDYDSHDDVYQFFLKNVDELCSSYFKLFAGIKDLELSSVHEREKAAIYAEFEDFRGDYATQASSWLEQASQVDSGFDYIEQSFKNELASLQQRIVDAEQLIETLQAPRRFRGETNVDKAGNRIIDHFASSGVIVDAIESVKLPGGFQLRFKVDRNPDRTKLAESEFDKHCEHLGLWGLSQRPLDFDLDTRNFLLSVNLYAVPDGQSRSLSESKRSSTKAKRLSPEQIAERFQQLDCYSAAEFEEIVRSKFVPRVRVVAGSTGGKSPLLELIACAIAQTQKGQLWLINPIPGSPKDWFHVPGVIAPGSDGIQSAIAWLGKAHEEFKTRRNDLPGSASKPFITIVVDEINAIAREFPELGTVMKDFYQLSDHTRMGFLTAGQGGNVSGVSGGSKSSSKTGNASKLMEEDFQNSTQVFTSAAAKTWIEKYLKGSQMTTYLDRLTALNALCAELNQTEGKSAYPTDPTSKKVSPDAYRVALVVSPREADPFFIQIPAYSSYVRQLEGVDYPEGAIVTAPSANQAALGLMTSLDRKPQSVCSHCGHETFRRKGTYKTGKPKYVCSQCGRVPSPVDAAPETAGQNA